MNILVTISKVSDGNMYNRNDVLDEAIVENRKMYLQKHNISIDQTTRVRTNYNRDDFCRYIEVDEMQKNQGMYDDEVVIADALITTDADHALFLPIADCVGATIFDPTHNVLAVAHLGRHSLEQSGAHKIINHLVKNYGSTASELKIWLTPAPGKDVYPIWALDNKGMKEVTFEQLYAAGILQQNIVDNPIETDKNPDYFSYTEFFNGRRTDDGDYAIVAMMTN